MAYGTANLSPFGDVNGPVLLSFEGTICGGLGVNRPLTKDTMAYLARLRRVFEEVFMAVDPFFVVYVVHPVRPVQGLRQRVAVAGDTLNNRPCVSLDLSAARLSFGSCVGHSA